MRFWWKCAAAVVAAAFASPQANAQDCNISRKSMVFKVSLCNPSGCTLGQERIDFVGEKAIHYSNAASQLGTVYYLGQTVDFCNPQLETYRPALCLI